MRAPVLLLFVPLLAAQNPPLAPTSNLVLDTNPTQGMFAFSSIAIPAGVRVSFRGNYAVQIACDGNAAVDGRLDVDATGSQSGAGAVLTGWGSPGQWWDPPYSIYVPPGGGQHAGLYGSAVPFDLAGGSPGGWVDVMTGFANRFFQWGGGGGGTVVLEANGRIDIHGRVSANGDSSGYYFFSTGSGGSILLRGLAGLTVHTGGTVSAVGADNGIVRLEAYGQAPSVLGVVQPAATMIQQPNLTETAAPVLGSTWELRMIAPRSDGVFLAASFQPGSATNAYGTVGIDLAAAITFAVVGVSANGHDPMAFFRLPVPNLPGLHGLQLWVAGLDWFTAQPPRYTNTLAVTVP